MINKVVMLTEEQKTLLFYALEAVQKTLYFDKEFNSFDYDWNSFHLQAHEYNKLAKDMNGLHKLIDKTLDDLC